MVHDLRGPRGCFVHRLDSENVTNCYGDESNTQLEKKSVCWFSRTPARALLPVSPTVFGVSIDPKAPQTSPAASLLGKVVGTQKNCRTPHGQVWPSFEYEGPLLEGVLPMRV